MNEDKSYAMDATAVMAAFDVDSKTGLTDAQVQASRKLHGRNEIPPPERTSFIKLVISQFSDLLVLILLGAAVVSFILALFEDSEDRVTAFVEPAVILLILIANATVGVVQETNAEKAIEKLKESEARDARVLRNGHVSTLHASELVPGDIIFVEVGDKVPADARLVQLISPALLVTQAMLTGEPEEVGKRPERVTKPNAVLQEMFNMVFSGTLIVRGKASAVVVHTGPKTAMGQIATSLKDEEDTKTPLQKKLDEFGEQLSKVISVICVVVWVINIGHFTDPDHGGLIRGAIYYFKIAVALAVAAIPEGLPAVVTTCLALGTMKMAKKNAIVRSLPSVETLGCTTVICSDKTGTLTTNMMSVQKVLAVDTVKPRLSLKEFAVEGDSFSPIGRVLRCESKSSNIPIDAPAVQEPSLRDIAKICSLCNEASLEYRIDEKSDRKEGSFQKSGAPTEAALKVVAEKIGIPEPDANQKIFSSKDPNRRARACSDYWASRFERKHLLEFSRDRKSMSVVMFEPQTRKNWLFCKGAPESVLGII